MPVGRIAEARLVSISYVSKVLSRRRLTGETTARPQWCHVPRNLAGHLKAIETHVESHPDATLPELSTWLAREHQVVASISLLSETLRERRLALKKDLPRCRAGLGGLAARAAIARSAQADLCR